MWVQWDITQLTLLNNNDIWDKRFLTLKMTAAKAVETSVTSTNSLSQDYTNLDDQLPQTCYDSPRFKPFTLNWIIQQTRIFFGINSLPLNSV